MTLPDRLEIKQVPSHIVKAFVAKYGKIGQMLDETDWLELFEVWHAGWISGAMFERKVGECSIDTTQ